jgi:hypothetical protein
VLIFAQYKGVEIMIILFTVDLSISMNYNNSFSGKQQAYSYLNNFPYTPEVFRRGKFILALQNNAVKNVRATRGRGGLVEAVRAHVFVFQKS